MREPAFTPDFFGDIIRIIQNIPIVNGKINSISGQSKLDARFGIGNDDDIEILKQFGIDDDSISLRDILKLFNKFLHDEKWFVVLKQQIFQNLRGKVSYPVEYLLFDYCLAALDNDKTDALLYASHSYHMLNLEPSFYMALNVIVNDALTQDPDVREFLVLLAFVSEPVSASSHTDSFGEDYKRRFDTYRSESKRHLN